MTKKILTQEEIQKLNNMTNKEVDQLLQSYQRDIETGEAILHTLIKFGLCVVALLVLLGLTHGKEF